MSASEQATKYRLKVTAGCDYDPTTHQDVLVNEDQTLHLENEHASTNLSVRVQNYTGYPDNSPKSNAYFTHPLHTKDQYSISFAISFKHPVNGNNLVFGNDFDRPIRDRLPPGFNAALRLVQWTIDPSLQGDAYADRPYLYSPALATWNQFRVGEKVASGKELPDVHGLVVEEGGDEEVREGAGVPGTVDGRRGHFQNEVNRKAWEFEEGRVYYADFGNQYLDFNEFTLRLPGFNINALNYIDEKTHSLRYVLKDCVTAEVYLVVMFTLILVGESPSEETTKGDGGKSSERFEWEEIPAAGDVD
ncbi:hypothetical protein BJX99DRAFT_162556 [Aspergillus californicus]